MIGGIIQTLLADPDVTGVKIGTQLYDREWLTEALADQEATMQKLTQGRIVRYVSENDGGEVIDAEKAPGITTWPALVILAAGSHTAKLLNVEFDHGATRLHDVGFAPREKMQPGTWHWPPRD